MIKQNALHDSDVNIPSISWLTSRQRFLLKGCGISIVGDSYHEFLELFAPKAKGFLDVPPILSNLDQTRVHLNRLSNACKIRQNNVSVLTFFLLPQSFMKPSNQTSPIMWITFTCV